MSLRDGGGDGDDNAGPKKKIGLKVKSNFIGEQAKIKTIKDNFDKFAEQKFEDIQNYKSEIWDLSLKYKSFIESKVLAENRGQVISNLEKETLESLIRLASEMNDDETQDNGIGSNALCMLLMKCMLMQRDRINQLNFKIDQLELKNSK